MTEPDNGDPRSRPALGRALFVFAFLPGTFAIALPAAWLGVTGTDGIAHAVGLVPFASGLLSLGWCVREFHVSGRGTIAPWEPPRRLVARGLYRFSRNPMYVSVLVIVVGWALTFGSWALALYAAALAGVFHTTVVHSEEPWLERTFGDEWRRYAEQVPRWLWPSRRRL